MKKQYDLLWKKILEPFFFDFLKFVDPKFTLGIDMGKKPTFLDKELVRPIPCSEGEIEHRIVDKLVKVYTRSGKAEWVLFHLEIQHSYNKNFPERMYHYFHGLYQKFKKPIAAYAIFTEPGNVKRDNLFKLSYGDTKIEYHFNTCKIALQDDYILKNDTNPFALIILIAKQTNFKHLYKDKQLYDQKLLANKLEIAKLIFERNLDYEKESNLIFFLFYYVNFEFNETNATFEREIKLLTNKPLKYMTMQELILEERKFEGLQEGLKLGRKQTKEAMVLKMIEMQFASDEEIVKIAEVTPGFVSRQRKKLTKLAGQVN